MNCETMIELVGKNGDDKFEKLNIWWAAPTFSLTRRQFVYATFGGICDWHTDVRSFKMGNVMHNRSNEMPNERN